MLYVAKAIEYMIVDALTLAEPVLNIARRLENPKKYLRLTDAIMEEILASEDPVWRVHRVVISNS